MGGEASPLGRTMLRPTPLCGVGPPPRHPPPRRAPRPQAIPGADCGVPQDPPGVISPQPFFLGDKKGEAFFTGVFALANTAQGTVLGGRYFSACQTHDIFRGKAEIEPIGGAFLFDLLFPGRTSGRRNLLDPAAKSFFQHRNILGHLGAGIDPLRRRHGRHVPGHCRSLLGKK